MAETDGVIQRDHECHCRRCERPALGLGRTHEEAVRALKHMGWKRIGSRWHCYYCAAALRELKGGE